MGGGASPVSKKPLVPGASTVWPALPAELRSGWVSGRKGPVGHQESSAATSRCDLASEPCPQFPHQPIWAGGMLVARPSAPLPFPCFHHPPSPAAPQEHPVPKKHHPLEPYLGLHPAQCHVVCGPAHHEPRSPPEQRGMSWRGSPRVRGRVWMGWPWWKMGQAQALRPNKTGMVPWWGRGASY